MKIFIVVFLAFSTVLLGRGPAIEPTIGISIDGQKPVSTQNTKGFDFSQETKDENYVTLEKSNLEELIVLLVLLMGFPLIFFLFLKINKGPEPKDQILEILEKYPQDEDHQNKKAG